MLKQLKEAVLDANLELPRRGHSYLYLGQCHGFASRAWL